jgi:hypothetical protein
LDSSDYRRAIAECITEAASRGLVEKYVRVGSRGRVANLAEFGEALYITHLVAEHPDHEMRRLWLALDWFQPQLGFCVRELRYLERAERYIQRGEDLLDELRRKTEQASPGCDGGGGLAAGRRPDKCPATPQ